MDQTPTKSYRPSEVAEKLGCTVDHVYRMIKYGNLTAIKIGGKRFYRVTDHDLEDFIQRMKTRNHELKHG